jgi:hypothetical protein
MGAYGAEEGAERATEWARAEQAVRRKKRKEGRHGWAAKQAKPGSGEGKRG